MRSPSASYTAVDDSWTGWTTSGIIGLDGAGSSSGSITTALSAANASGCLKACFSETQDPCGIFAFEYGCHEDCGVESKPGGASVESPGVCHPSSVD